MESLVKRYFWVVNLVLLAILAFLAARVINNVIAGEIAALPTTPRAAEGAKIVHKSGLAAAEDWSSAIQNRNLFNANPPADEPDAGAGETDGGPLLPEGTPPGEGMECEASESKIGLLATMVAEPATWSMAIVEDGEADDSRLVKENQRVGEFVLVSIQPRRVVLAKGNHFECVELGAKKKRRRPKRHRGYTAPSSKAKSNIKDGIKKIGKNRYQIDREMLNEQLDDLGALSRQARVIPHYRDGKPQGFKIVGVRPGSLYSHIGIRSGDVIKGINDEEITSPNKALELYEKLKNSDNVTVDIERRGRKNTLEYEIK